VGVRARFRKQPVTGLRAANVQLRRERRYR